MAPATCSGFSSRTAARNLSPADTRSSLCCMQCLAPHHNSPMAPLSQASFPRLTARCDNHPVGDVHSKQGLRPKEKHPMKQLFACTGLLLAATTLFAQTDATKPPPASPPATAS